MSDDPTNISGLERLAYDSFDVRPQSRALDVFCRLLNEAAFPVWYWRSPEDEILVGSGAAASKVVVGGDAGWRSTFPDQARSVLSSIGSRATAGDATVFFNLFFDPDGASHDGWEGFAPMSLQVPSLLFTFRAGRSSGTICCAAEEEARLRTVAMRAQQEADPGLEAAVETLSATMDWNEVPFTAAVEHAIRLLRRGDLEKVVLARQLEMVAEREIRIPILLQKLQDAYRDCFLYAHAPAPGLLFVSATPERLARVNGRVLTTAAVAGTVPTGHTLMEEQQHREQLRSDPKNWKEHTFVATMIHDALRAICDEVVIEAPEVLRLRNVQHLVTPLRGRLAERRGLIDAVAQLHPTPAVCGAPRESALNIISRYENFRRGQYAGVAGWMHANGSGDSAVTIRSALLRGRNARLFAGAGLVSESLPRHEVDETRIKLQAVLSALAQS
jgi:menaquinone-specific isochorismate synthase